MRRERGEMCAQTRDHLPLDRCLDLHPGDAAPELPQIAGQGLVSHSFLLWLWSVQPLGPSLLLDDNVDAVRAHLDLAEIGRRPPLPHR
jgi:hypothetical protein